LTAKLLYFFLDAVSDLRLRVRRSHVFYPLCEPFPPIHPSRALLLRHCRRLYKIRHRTPQQEIHHRSLQYLILRSPTLLRPRCIRHHLRRRRHRRVPDQLGPDRRHRRLQER